MAPTKFYVLADPLKSNYEISLSKLVGKKIEDVRGFIDMQFDTPVFNVSDIVFTDKTTVTLEGEHDCAYIPSCDSQPNLDEDTLMSLSDEGEE